LKHQSISKPWIIHQYFTSAIGRQYRFWRSKQILGTVIKSFQNFQQKRLYSKWTWTMFCVYFCVWSL